MRKIATAIAALALAASAGHAQGNGHGRPGGGKEHGNAGRHDNGGRGPAAHAPGQGGQGRLDRGNPGSPPGHGNDRLPVVSDDRGPNRDVRGPDHAERRWASDRRLVVIDGHGHARDIAGRNVVHVRDFAALPGGGLVDGCPPGLARKNPPCVPPGQVRSPFRSFDRPGFWGLRLDDGRYRYDDGYLVRLAPGGGIGGYVPLLGGALSIGNLWPAYYEPVALPRYYESYYGLGPYESYRYADNVIYQVDPETAAITSIAALLTGDSFAVGQPMPAGYDVYNVPYRYRDRYHDTPDALYRYSDGYVYQVDPETRLIAAAIELLAS